MDALVVVLAHRGDPQGRMSFFRNLAGVLLTTAASAPIGLVTSILLARFLSTDDRGLYAIAVTFAATATMLFQFGWPTAAIYRLRSAQQRPAEVSTAVLVFLGGIGTLVVLASVAIEAPLRERLLSDLPKGIFYLALVTVPFRLLANGFGSIARGIDRFRYENWYAFLLQAANLLAIAITIVWLGGALGELMAGLAIVYGTLVIGLIVAVVRQTGVGGRLKPSEMRSSLRFGLKTYAMTVTGRLHERVDIFMLAALLADPTQIAFYAIAKGAIQLVQLLPSAVAKVAYPQLAELQKDDAAEFACSLVRQGLLFTLPASLILFVAGPLLLPLVYGAPYAASVLPFLLLLPAVILLGTEGVLARYFTGTNRHKPNIVTRGVTLCVNVALNWIWIPKYGIAGAAAAALASSVVDAVLIVGVFLSVSGRQMRDLVAIRRTDLEPYLRQLGKFAARLRPSTP
ncbi:MAG: oligosaccharide flippase family protein [Myxococcota bacterium]|nr:oligosaccharide flippase family protein [Myxococcota bacterium]